MSIEFTPHPEIALTEVEFDPARHKTIYRHNYEEVCAFVVAEPDKARETFRELILNDLFFVVMFVMQIEKANHPFVVQRCHEVQDGPPTMTLSLWAREHFKSCIITQAETLQYHLRNPEHCTGIFAYVRPVAKAFLRSIKVLCETSDLLKWCFPDILWEKPETQAPKWSEDDGLVFKRKSASRKESTIEAWGLVEGMPTSRHFDRRIYDDIETADIADSPDMLSKCFSKFEMSDNLGVDGGVERVIGTFYSHYGPLVKIRAKKDVNGNPMYHTSIIPATHNGQRTGRPVLLSQERLDKLQMSPHFDSQQLCDPTPSEDIKLDFSMMKPIEPGFIPKDIYKFMMVDQAGDDDTNITSGDSWSMVIVGVKPVIDELGASDVYLLDIMSGPMGHAEAINNIVTMYCRAGVVMQLGIEKAGLSTTEIHVAGALRAKGRRLSVENKTLVLLRPGGRSKNQRIESALQWPLNNSKLHYSTEIPEKYIEAIREEMNKFPFFHVDLLDAWAYAYDMIKEFRFQTQRQQEGAYDWLQNLNVFRR